MAPHLHAHYGDDFDDWGRPNPYFRVEADRCYAADMSVHLAADAG